MEDKQENSLELEVLIRRPENRQPDKIEPSPLDSSFNERKREESERHEQDELAKAIEDGDIDDISDILTPKTLTESHNKNALMVAMETSFDLRRLACEKGPSEEDFISLANSVDQFSSCLLDPLKSDTEARHAFGDSIDEVMDAAINLEQKQVKCSLRFAFYLFVCLLLAFYVMPKRELWRRWCNHLNVELFDLKDDFRPGLADALFAKIRFSPLSIPAAVCKLESAVNRLMVLLKNHQSLMYGGPQGQNTTQFPF